MTKASAGDFVRLEFTGKDASGKVFETTREQDAKAGGLFDPRAKYSPALVVVGRGHLLPGLDEALAGAEEGTEQNIVIPKEKAFGNRDPNLVRLVPLSQFKQANVEPLPGAVVELDGRRARVQSADGGRVRVDFNHELAGQDLSYSFKVV
ncbi:MAG: peptidylprolyl isomerase, partial [Candidatus Micrarchaeota archaeon]